MWVKTMPFAPSPMIPPFLLVICLPFPFLGWFVALFYPHYTELHGISWAFMKFDGSEKAGSPEPKETSVKCHPGNTLRYLSGGLL